MSPSDCSNAAGGKLWSGFTQPAKYNEVSPPRVWVTRPAHQADGLCEQLRQRGFDPIRFPTIEIVPTRHPDASRRLLMEWPTYDWVFFISANAVDHAHALLAGEWPSGHPKIAAIGKKTEKRLQKHGLFVDLVPEKRFTTEDLIEKLGESDLKGSRCLIVKGEAGRDALAKALQQQGAQVDLVDVYRRCLPTGVEAELPQTLQATDFVTITSQLALDHLFALMGAGKASLQQATLVVISERIADYARRKGCRHIVLAGHTSDEGLVDALVAVTSKL